MSDAMSDPNDRFRAMQIALVEAGTRIATEHGFAPEEVKVTVTVRLPPQVQFITVTLTQSEPCVTPKDEEDDDD